MALTTTSATSSLDAARGVSAARLRSSSSLWPGNILAQAATTLVIAIDRTRQIVTLIVPATKSS